MSARKTVEGICRMCDRSFACRSPKQFLCGECQARVEQQHHHRQVRMKRRRRAEKMNRRQHRRGIK